MATVAAEEKIYTPDDLLRMEKLGEPIKYDLIDGRLVERHMGTASGLVEMNLGGMLSVFVRTQQLGWVLGPSTGYQIFGRDGNNVRYADGSFLSRDRIPAGGPPRGHMRIAPDLAIEVVSPKDLAEELEQKIEDYLQVGIRLIWVVFCNTRRVMVYRRRNGITRLSPADELSGEDVVPGFACPVADVFAGL